MRYQANYTSNDKSGKPQCSHLEVVAFENGATPLVLAGGHVRYATDVSGYRGIMPSHKQDIVAMIPGGNWFARYSEEDGSFYDEPVLLWVVDTLGDVYARTVSGAQYASDPAEVDKFHSFVQK